MLADRGAVAERRGCRAAERLEPWCERLGEGPQLGVARVAVGGDDARGDGLGLECGVALMSDGVRRCARAFGARRAPTSDRRRTPGRAPRGGRNRCPGPPSRALRLPWPHPRIQPRRDDLDEAVGNLELRRVPDAVQHLDVEPWVAQRRGVREVDAHEAIVLAVHEERGHQRARVPSWRSALPLASSRSSDRAASA